MERLQNMSHSMLLRRNQRASHHCFDVRCCLVEGCATVQGFSLAERAMVEAASILTQANMFLLQNINIMNTAIIQHENANRGDLVAWREAL